MFSFTQNKCLLFKLVTANKYEMENNIYSPDYVKALFNRMSSSYERVNYLTSFGFSIRWRTQFLSSFHCIKPQSEVIDLLTGMGETWGAIKNKLPNSNLTVLDFSEGMLKYAKQKSKRKFNAQITVLQQDVLSNELPSNHFDIVTCAFGLKTFSPEQLNILASETKRILKTGGQFSFIEVSVPNNKILRFFYGFYVGQVIPMLGRLLLGNPKEYKMLWQYTSKFGNAKRVSGIFADVGLKTTFNSYFYGCATGFYGEKISD
jgi:ubiquinone/menaquinone biosynthesis methyltransferase